MQLLIYLYDGDAYVLDGSNSEARELIEDFGRQWIDWPEDLGVYDQGDGFLILETDYGEEFTNTKFTRMTEQQFHLVQTYGTIWFE